MKKYMSLFILWLIAITLTGCSAGENNSEVSTEADGTKVTIDERGIDKSVNSIPYDKIYWNEEVMSLESIDIYQEKSDSGHGYFPYVVVRIDTTSMSEDGLYWMMKDQEGFGIKTFDEDVYLTSEKNEINHERMSLLYGWYDNNEIVSIYWLSDEYRYDFLDAELSVCINIEQDETYEYEDGELQKSNTYTWRINNEWIGEIELPVQDSENMPDDIVDGIQNGYLKILTD